MITLAGLVACGEKTPRSPEIPGDPAWNYQVVVEPSGDLAIDATLHGSLAGLHVDEDVSPYVSAPVVEGARVRYRVRLRAAGIALHTSDSVTVMGGALIAPPSTWLLRPASPPTPDARYRVHVIAPPGESFATGVRPAPGRADTYEAAASSLEQDTSFAAFGKLRVVHVADPGVDAILAPDLPKPDAYYGAWARAEVDAITKYFARVPDDRAAIFIVPNPNDAMSHGKTFGDGGASVLFQLGTLKDQPPLEEDWVLAHEMIHVATPSLPRAHAWFEEGMATYVEPIARARAGMITAEKVWFDLADNLDRGVAKTDDTGGLDGARDVDRVYWGGALYFVLADLELRERTGNKLGLEHALRGLARGANVETHRSIREVIDAADRATGTKVFFELYEKMGNRPMKVDLEALFRRIGVKKAGETVIFDETAPLAAVRRSVTTAR